MTNKIDMTRREAVGMISAALLSNYLTPAALKADSKRKNEGSFRFALASSLFGCLPLEEILAVTKSTGAHWIDLWPRIHGDQREQVERMGEDAFVALLRKYDIRLGLTTRFDLGPLKLADEMKFVKKHGGEMIVTGAAGPKGLKGDALKKEIGRFCERIKPSVEQAEANRVILAVENHSMMLLDSPDAVRYFSDAIDSPMLKIAFAPYHLPQDATELANLVRHCGSKLAVFYAWQHGKGSMEKLLKTEELEQLPGLGPLDFGPIWTALHEIGFDGFVEVFMHPFPRGIPIRENAVKSAAEIAKAMTYLEKLPRATK